ncbi:MAG: imidazoleglycerol-phosphate dehydratase HisB [Candidatus Electrothrix aestuarii]|uniref:Imidazoleglycerol-phosphate dehydratase n=1 Tax=Candidatus Electrothrix aestuarii TaxID=3062594 RepID=A0AAU8LZD5_9BACT|nr:imidazoleglycerol-phosphate dehydratase HisB [Candidatus Electrothrix aestuarii]
MTEPTTTISPRESTIERETLETQIALQLNIDGSGKADISTGVGFLDHMLTLFTVHGFFDLSVQAKGDTYVDDHHTVEDIGICLGQAFAQALGNKAGIHRYAHAYVPMDETLARVCLDFSNRPFLHYDVAIRDQKVGNFDTALVLEFLRAVAQYAGITLHVDLLHGENAHHIIEAVFKALGRAMGEGASLRQGLVGTLSSKGSL